MQRNFMQNKKILSKFLKQNKKLLSKFSEQNKKNLSKDWCHDSGCTSHLCKDEENFMTITETKNQKLNPASNSSTDLKSRGTVTIASKFKRKCTNPKLQRCSLCARFTKDFIIGRKDY